MIILVNNELITEKTSEEKGRFRTQFQSANKLIAGKNPKPVNQTIISALHPNEERNNEDLIVVRYTEQKNGKMKASLTTVTPKDKKGDTRYSPVIIAAVPFNGILAPIQEVDGIRIHRAFIGKMPNKTTITIDGKKYRKIAFLVMTPNMMMFDPKSKHHVDKLTLNVVSYNYESSKGERKTVKQTFTIDYSHSQDAPDYVHFTTVWEDSEPISSEDLGDKFLFPLYRPKKLFKKGSTQTSKISNNRMRQSKQSGKPDEPLTQKLNLDQMLGNFDNQSKERQSALNKRSKSRQK